MLCIIRPFGCKGVGRPPPSLDKAPSRSCVEASNYAASGPTPPTGISAPMLSAILESARLPKGCLGACAAGSREPVRPRFMEENILFSVDFRTLEGTEMRNRGGKSYFGQCAGTL